MAHRAGRSAQLEYLARTNRVYCNIYSKALTTYVPLQAMPEIDLDAELAKARALNRELQSILQEEAALQHQDAAHHAPDSPLQPTQPPSKPAGRSSPGALQRDPWPEQLEKGSGSGL